MPGATTSSDGSCASFSPSLTLDYSLPTGYRLAYPTSPVSTPDAGAFDEDHHVGALLMSEESSRSVVAWEPCDLTPAFVDDLAASFEVSGWMVDPTCGEVEVEETPRCGVGDDFDSIEGASAILANCVAENGPMLLEFVDLRKLITTLHSAPRVLRYASCAYACFFSAAAASRALASAYYKMARVAVFQEPGGDIASTAGLVQALMLLGIYAKANGDSHAASIFNAMAARLSQLRLRDAACGTSAHDLWLQCVCLDNLSAFLTERPAFLPPSDLDVSGTRFLERFASLSSLLQAAREAGSNTRVLAMIERDLECWQAGRTEFGRNCDIAVNEARNDLLDACAGLAAIVLRSSPGRRSAEPTVVEGARRVVAAVTGDAERSSRLAGLARRAGLADLVGLCALRSSSALKTDVEALEGNKTFMELLGCNADWVACVRDMVVEARGRVSLKVEGVWEVTTAAAAEPAVGYKDVVVGGESLMDFCDSLLTFEGVG
ncbi:hypothetical protein HK101_006046 [Irineochytrium annulatum]|nr:hypothetical protein HK101_006046 [Irineochytrium annulatum]